ncbi:AMP-dependent synthetase/ligase [Phytoactinopolyspora mesophila]|uniref:Acyl-CoA synthetase n=1 Tax=Phytoactinopolyspora mesophila TaxID=2650750 RepID=A0A7K3M0I0_9ACTN|nr:long-chain fatty acid--CoA ligase [Phytoactinopolyspora mesophila]NDL56805.1 AMP-binding protein [Phytoactinopolyspora mesophila]
MSLTHVKGPEPAEIGSREHALARLWAQAEERSDQVILKSPADQGWNEMTWSDLVENVRSLAAGLVAAGVESGDRVGLMSPTRVEWTLADLGILAAGAITVPLYDTSSADQVRGILSDAGARLVIVADSDLADRVREVSDAEIVVIDDGDLDGLRRRGGAAEHDEADRRRDALTTDDVATIVYTSGTTGDPKGCVLTHGNVAWTIRQTRDYLDDVLGQGGSLLQFLPLAHIFARLIQFVCLDSNVTVGFPESPQDPRDDIRSFQPTLLLGVPRVFEKVFEAARRQASGPVKKAMFNAAVSTAQATSMAERPGPVLRARRAVADRLVYAKLRNALGGHVRYCVSGGAPLSTDLAHFYRGAGVPIFEGYGLTETTAPATVNVPDAVRVGSVGRPLPGVEVRIDDGEILVKGRNVFERYFHEDGRNDEDFDGEWFRTGDLGELDDDGFLFVRERKKELIVTASGKNIAPAPLENAISSHELVSQAMLVGDQKRFVAALVTLDEDEARSFAKKHDLPDDTSALKEDETVRAEVQQAIDEANQKVSRAESIREFVILDREFTERDGELTPTMKLRRRDIAEHFADEIDSIYAA